MKNTLNKTAVFDSPRAFYELLYDHRYEINDIIRIKEDLIRVVYHDREEYIEEHQTSNVLVASLTTDAARVLLHQYLKKVDDHPGCRVLYCDTDSVILSHPRGDCPLEEGMFLGEMVREYAEFDIEEFVSGGPKQYSLKLRNKKTGEIKSVLKIRGITMDHNTSSLINHEGFKEKVLNIADQTPIYTSYTRIQPTRDAKIIEFEQRKKYESFCTKGPITKDWQVLPFGYK